MLGVFLPHLPCEIAEANSLWFHMGFPSDSCRLSMNFDRTFVIFNQFQSASVNSNQFQSVWLGQKRRNWWTTGRRGKQHLIGNGISEANAIFLRCWCTFEAFGDILFFAVACWGWSVGETAVGQYYRKTAFLSQFWAHLFHPHCRQPIFIFVRLWAEKLVEPPKWTNCESSSRMNRRNPDGRPTMLNQQLRKPWLWMTPCTPKVI